jgi:hypothetical protein
MSAYTFMHLAISFLIVGSLILMVARIYLPWIAKPDEPILMSYVIPFRLRTRLQRANIYSLAGLLLLGTIGQWINPLSLLLTIACTMLILAVPVRYSITKSGIILGRTPICRWEEFSSLEQRSAHVHLNGTGDWRPLNVWLPRPPEDAEVIALMRRFLPSTSAVASKKTPTKTVHSKKSSVLAARTSVSVRR